MLLPALDFASKDSLSHFSSGVDVPVEDVGTAELCDFNIGALGVHSFELGGFDFASLGLGSFGQMSLRSLHLGRSFCTIVVFRFLSISDELSVCLRCE